MSDVVLGIRIAADGRGVVDEVGKTEGAIHRLRESANDYNDEIGKTVRQGREHAQVMSAAANDARAVGAGYGLAAVGVIAFAVAMAAGMAHYERTARALNEIEVRLAATGRQAMLTRGELAGVVRDLGTDTVAALASIPRIGAPLFRDLTGIVKDFAAATGKTLPEAMRDLGKSFQDPVKGAQALDQQLALLNANEMLLIESLARQGRVLEAQDVLFSVLHGRIKGLHEQGLTPLQRATDDLSNAWGQLWRQFAESGPVEIALAGLSSLIDKAALAVGAVAAIRPETLLPGIGPVLARGPAGSPGGRSIEEQLAEQDRAIAAGIDAQVAAAVNLAGAYQGVNDQLRTLRENEQKLRMARGLAGGEADERIGRGLDAIALERARITGTDPASVQAREEQTAFDHAMEENRQNALFGATEQNLRRGAQQARLGTIADPAARARAQLDLEKQLIDESIAQAQIGEDKKQALYEKSAEFYLAKQQALTEQLKPEYQKMLEAWSDTNRAMRDSWDRMATGMLRTGEDIFVRFAQTGKLQITDLANFIQAEMARALYRSAASSVFGFFGFGGGGGRSTGASEDFGLTGGEFHRGGRVGIDAGATRRVPAGTFIGAPRLHSGLAADEYPAILQAGETVLPRGVSAGPQIHAPLSVTIHAPGADAGVETRIRAALREELPQAMYQHRRVIVGLLNNHRRESGRGSL